MERGEDALAKLQDGIYWDKGTTPPRCFAIAFFKADREATALGVAALLTRLVALWDGLKDERLADLPGVRVPRSGFEWLIGFGIKAFKIGGAAKQLPRRLDTPNIFNSVDPAGGGGKVLDGSGLDYAKGLALNPASEEICVQFTGDTPLSVSRAIVETWKLIESARDPATGRSALALSASFTGFNREDQRSWLGFHDGLSNLESGSARKSVIAVKRQGLPPIDRWTVDGTYMAFMRLAVDLRQWEQLGLQEQETLVGRTRITGCPLRAAHVAGQAQTVDGCPAPGSNEVTGDGNEAFREPPDGVDEVITKSHVQRANHHFQPQRIYRQGYEFAEMPMPGRPLAVGLNFVSFQDNPDRLFGILKNEGWLGATNFGGAPGPQLLTALAAGVFFCPARDDAELFPGASIFPTLVAAVDGPVRVRTRSAGRGTRRA